MMVENLPSNPSNTFPQSLQFSHLGTNNVPGQIHLHQKKVYCLWIALNESLIFFAIVNSEYRVLIYCLQNKYSERKCLFLKNGAIQQHFADVHIVIFHSCKVQNQNIHEISWTKSTHTIFTYLFTLFNLISRSTCICFNVSTFWLKHPEAYCSNHQ